MNRQPIDHPCVWKGRELLERPDWRMTWTEAELAEIDRLVEDPEADVPSAAPQVTARLHGLRDALEEGSGAALIQGLDVTRRAPDQWAALFERLSGQIGTPISQSAAGEKVFSVRNAGFADDDPRARGPNTNRKLSFHTDRCDVIAFLCLQAAREGGDNQVVSSAAIYNAMLSRHPDLLEVLMKPFYYQRHNVDVANEQPWTRQPIFSFHEGHFAANFLRVLIERAHANPELPDLSDTQREALDTLESIADDPSFHVTFRQAPGDLVFFNNWVTLHRRTAFEDYPEPNRRRHILRIWLSMPNSRPLDPLFAGNYGATAAGAIRGGMRAGAPNPVPRG